MKKLIAKKSDETLDDVLREFFKGESTLYFHSSDAMKMLAGDTYLKYDRKSRGQITLSVCGDDGEAVVKVCTSPVDLRRLIQAIIW